MFANQQRVENDLPFYWSRRDLAVRAAFSRETAFERHSKFVKESSLRRLRGRWSRSARLREPPTGGALLEASKQKARDGVLRAGFAIFAMMALCR